MRTTPALLAAVLALAGLPAFAADHDHGAATQGGGAGPATEARAGGCKMMMKKKGGHAAKDGGAAPGKPGMCGCMARRHAGGQGPVLEAALPPDRVASLGLDAGQRESLAALEKQNRITQWALLGELREERLALAEQLAAPEPDPATTTARLRAVQDVEARLFEARLVTRHEALALLTPEQRARLAGPHPRKAEAMDGTRDQATAGPKDDEDDDEDDEAEDPHAAHH